jgi:hypothetical protein
VFEVDEGVLRPQSPAKVVPADQSTTGAHQHHEDAEGLFGQHRAHVVLPELAGAQVYLDIDEAKAIAVGHGLGHGWVPGALLPDFHLAFTARSLHAPAFSATSPPKQAGTRIRAVSRRSP